MDASPISLKRRKYKCGNGKFLHVDIVSALLQEYHLNKYVCVLKELISASLSELMTLDLPELDEEQQDVQI